MMDSIGFIGINCIDELFKNDPSSDFLFHHVGLGLGYVRGYGGCIRICLVLISLPFCLCGFGL
jgi:hypothetical protein